MLLDNFPAVNRYFWYFYYIPMELVPLIGLFAVMCMGKPESYKFSKAIKLLYWLAKVVSAKAIAEKMGVSVDCVNEHLKHLKEKTGCSSKTQFAILA